MLSKMGTERNAMGGFATLNVKLGLVRGPRTASFGLYYRCTTFRKFTDRRRCVPTDSRAGTASKRIDTRCPKPSDSALRYCDRMRSEAPGRTPALDG
ncbi:hypothetical protein PHSY_006264 [Pseudozyma hubeiensis SY62]|uniref:Uncharacterized protein n=1 Tax=Pseudozyma hubeiensis (strain SY62) TaxID=1305764 RepID=R9PKM4_PSEHS|nr:hypothetical protein PHSY_006264 [Pseudozyma hubeiensis SY62]GAC98670.1 hypothetical protein PHSY_006264 [Pseudozyma hubeiensis SY62]